MPNELTNDVKRRRSEQTSATGTMLSISSLALGRSAHVQGRQVVHRGS